MTISSNPLFKFRGDMLAVRVENVPQTVTRQEIVKLFATLIGEVRKCDEYFEEGKKRVFDVAFANPDTARKALCMSGYTVAGVPLAVSASCHMESQRAPKQNKQPDARRNLYVLGLPFDLTKSEFVEIFSRYGAVMHAVILATVDNASRRRGFVVMGSHKEAKFAMEALGRTEIKGHTIDVSWAVVQRSQGFLDGGDRTMVLSNSGSSGSSGFDSDSWDVSPPGSVGLVTPPLEAQAQVLPLSCSPTLLVTNLPSVLFSQPADLQPLLCPFGDVKNLKIVTDSPAAEQGNISVIVEYKTTSQAKDARDTLSGQIYANQPVQVEFLLPKTPALDVDSHSWSSVKGESKTGLNPYAAPFLVQNIPYQDGPTMPFSSYYGGPVVNVSEEGCNSSGLPPSAPSFASLPAFHSPAPPNSTGLCAPQADMFRPHSAPSRSLHGNNDVRPGHWTCSSVQALPDLSSASLRSPFIA
ncbi:hypothetical protein NM688_g1962 [Phlebia brevispora]|uniref:Uncharacterized protein n=1 Tax=Phlebia brevispora TaxID=194682 RepID=A0ACC1T9U4_9APHY|nr:hypothetical protein NM688_g1962 [Phlebia brevispora]